MWYFAYGSNLNVRAVTDWCKQHGFRPPNLKAGRAAVLDNYRLCFPIYSPYWGGGVGDIVYDPGKYVMGALFDLTEADLRMLDLKVGRKLDPTTNKEAGLYSQITVPVTPMGKTVPLQAITYTGTSVEKNHIPPTQHYMDIVIQGAYGYGLSMMWISYLKSFSTQTGRMPRPAEGAV